MKSRFLFLLLLMFFPGSAIFRLHAMAQEEIDIEEAMRLEQEGKSHKALSMYEKLINDSTETDFFRFYASLGKGRILSEAGDYQGAFDAYENGIGIATMIGADFIDGANARYNLANLYTQFGKYDAAEELLRYARWEKGSEGARKSAALSAVIASRQGDNRRALTIIDNIIPEFREDPFNKAVLLQNRGYILRDLKRYAEAEADFMEAVKLLTGMDKYVALSNLAMVQSDLGKTDEAIANINDVITHFRSAGNRPDLAIALRKKGEILAKAHRTAEAYKAFREFFEIDQKDIIHNLPNMSPSTRLDYWTKEKPSLSKVFLLNDYDPDFLADVAVFRHQTSMLGMNDMERLRENLSINTKTIQKSLTNNGVAIQFVEYETEPGKATYVALITPKRGKSIIVPLFPKSFIYTGNILYPYSLHSAVTGENREALNRLYESEEMARKVWAPVLEKLPAGTTDIYFTPEGIFHLWAIENMTYEPLDGLRLHRLSSMGALTESNETNDITGEALVIGGLDYSDENPLETERNTLEGNYAASEPDNADEESVMPDRSAFRALWEYVNPDEGANIFSYLPATRMEAEGISEVLPNSDKRNVISEETMKTDMGRYRTVHIATHGYCLDTGLGDRTRMYEDSIAVDYSLLYSGIALSGANNGNRLAGEDGILSAREICNLNLNNTDLITLSACQTAKGMITDEGASGLVRALKMAGGGSILASLWEVDDNSTRLFMEEFYRNLASGKSKRDSFNNAREYLKNMTQKLSHRKFSPSRLAGSKERTYQEITPYSEPYYHSPFILID